MNKISLFNSARDVDIVRPLKSFNLYVDEPDADIVRITVISSPYTFRL